MFGSLLSRLPRLARLIAAAAVVSAAAGLVLAIPSEPRATFDATLVAPIVLSCTGNAGAYFTSELTLTNRGTTSATVEMRYTAAFGGGDGTCAETLLSGEQKVIPDVIEYLHEKGLPLPATGDRGGTLQLSFSGLSSGDAAAVTVRTTTATKAPQPVGAAGLAYPGVAPGSGIPTVATLYGLRATAADRSNVAVYNPTLEPVTVKVTAYAGDGSGASAVKAEEMQLPALGWTQIGNVFDGTGFGSGWVNVERTGGTGSFGAYGVVNCNGTSDGSYVTPTLGSATGSRITVPVLVETPSGFLSELVLANRGASEATLTLSYVESLSPALGAGGSATVTLRPKEQLILPDALEWLRGKGVAIGPKGASNYAGALRVASQGASPSDVFAGARTASQCSAGGQFGLFTPGVYEGKEATKEAYLYALRADETNRTNVAVLNAGNDGAGEVTLEVQAYDGDAGGVSRGDPERVTLEPGGWYQAAGFLASKGVRNGWVKVTRTDGTAPWIAYAVVNDGARSGERTGDGAYVPMVPGAAPTTLGWEVSFIPEGRNGAVQLLLDLQGRPVVVYHHRSEPSDRDDEVKVARFDPATAAWTTLAVLPTTTSVWDAALDPTDGNPSLGL